VTWGRLGLASVTALVCMACRGGGDYVAWTLVAALPDGVELSYDRMSVPLGVTFSARATLIHDGDDSTCVPTVTALDDRIIHVEPAERGGTVFTGASVGSTEIVVECSGISVSVPAKTTSDPTQ
jgi:hypothetical protein